jgi:poly-gamma-glutamate synthesis protein (capsule biosynthesis protein)
MKSLLKGMLIGLCIGLFLLACAGIFLHFQKASASKEKIPTAEEDTTSGVLVKEVEKVEEPLPEAEEELPDEPEEEAVEIEEEETPSDATLAFAGDVMFPTAYLEAYDRSGILAITDEGMLTHMREADLFLLNEEFPFSLQGEPWPDKQYTFRTDPKYVSILEDLGADIVTVANNHSMDYGRDAFCDTLDTLAQTDITCIGGGYDLEEASAPAVRTVNGQTFAVFAATRVSPDYSWYATSTQAGIFQTYDPSMLNAAITQANEQYDHVIVFVHWGIERNETPEEYQRTLAKGYIDAGADLVVGCHPHVLQGFEYYNGVPIIYSLGNYLFESRSDATLLLNATFSSDDDSTRIQLIPCQRKSGVLTQISEPSSLFSHLTDLSFDVTVDDDGVLISQ